MMKGNKLSDKIFAVLLVLCVIYMLTGCSTYENNITTEYSKENTVSSEKHRSLEDLKFDPAKNNDVEDETETIVSAETTETTETVESEAIETVEPETEAAETVIVEAEEIDFNSVEAIAKICGLHALVEDGNKYCYVDTIEGANPYDVEWNYGAEYNKYVDACDWSLIFDADYYMNAFPMLAMQYHYDAGLLLKHFQTVGIHEGRQGSADFNVGAYLTNVDVEVWNAFEYNYEGYYFYYMLNYNTEKMVDAMNNKDGSKTYTQYAQVFTSAQRDELKSINEYRDFEDVQNIALDSELCAIANYRAYINAHDNYEAHDWFFANENVIRDWVDMLDSDTFSENTVTRDARNLVGHVNGEYYKKSPKHYGAMVDVRFNFTGVSHTYVGDDSSSQFDVFVPKLTTPMHD